MADETTPRPAGDGASSATWIALGDRAIRFARPATTSPRAIVRAVRTWPGVIDVVVAHAEVAAYFDQPPRIDPSLIRALATAIDDPQPARELELRASYNGPDLDDVARATRLSASEVCARGIRACPPEHPQGSRADVSGAQQ